MTRPVFTLVGVDRDRSYFYWQRIAPVPESKHSFVVDSALLAGSLAELANAIPIRRAGETEAATVKRVFTSEAFASLEQERALAGKLADLLLPPEFSEALADAFLENARNPVLLELMPSASTARVPWELFPVVVPAPDGAPETRRLIEIADIVHEVPAGIHVRRGRLPETTSGLGQALYVVDPFEPNTAVLGSVLDSTGHAVFRERMAVDGYEGSRAGAKFTRADLHRALTSQPAPGRVVYVGHVLAVRGDPGATSLVLSDPREMYGVASIYEDVNRPLSALDLLEGTLNTDARLPVILSEESLARQEMHWPGNRDSHKSGVELWPMPARVALIACNSGGDLGAHEPFGLVLAMINAGASLVTATRWTLPTDRAFQEIGGVASTPLIDAALAVDDAHAAPDAVASIAAWQRSKLAEWESAGSSLAASPILWAAFASYVGDERMIEQVEPTVDDVARLAPI